MVLKLAPNYNPRCQPRMPIGPTGMFNNGTNILPNLLYGYCRLPKRTNPLKSDIIDGGFFVDFTIGGAWL
jgi:hypothetical protein